MSLMDGHERAFTHAQELESQLAETPREEWLMLLKDHLAPGYEWRKIAIYMAECNAATAEYDGRLKRTSKHSRGRMASICEKGAEMVKHGLYMGPFRDRGIRVMETVERLVKAAEELREL